MTHAHQATDTQYSSSHCRGSNVALLVCDLLTGTDTDLYRRYGHRSQGAARSDEYAVIVRELRLPKGRNGHYGRHALSGKRIADAEVFTNAAG